MLVAKAEFLNATQAASKTVATLSQPASALGRIKLTYLTLGSEATADNQNHAQVKRTTAAGTATAVTATQTDTNDLAPNALIGQAHTVEPTYSGGSVLSAFFHQRSTFQWYAAPDHAIIIPKTNAAGLGVFMAAMTASVNIGGMLEWEE